MGRSVQIINFILKSTSIIEVCTSHRRSHFVTSLRSLDALLETWNKEMALLVRIGQLTDSFRVQVKEPQIRCVPDVTLQMNRCLLHRHSFTLYKGIILTDSRVFYQAVWTSIDTMVPQLQASFRILITKNGRRYSVRELRQIIITILQSYDVGILMF